MFGFAKGVSPNKKPLRRRVRRAADITALDQRHHRPARVRVLLAKPPLSAARIDLCSKRDHCSSSKSREFSLYFVYATPVRPPRCFATTSSDFVLMLAPSSPRSRWMRMATSA
jgi:hypothetical protein